MITVGPFNWNTQILSYTTERKKILKPVKMSNQKELKYSIKTARPWFVFVALQLVTCLWNK